jgi:hypothetical protein
MTLNVAVRILSDGRVLLEAAASSRVPIPPAADESPRPVVYYPPRDTGSRATQDLGGSGLYGVPWSTA